MDTTNIEKLIEIMDRAKLTALRFDDGEIKIEVERDATSSGSLPLIAERAAQFLGSGERALKHTDANIAVTDKDAGVVEEALHLLEAYTEGPYAALEKNADKVPEECRPTVLYLLNPDNW